MFGYRTKKGRTQFEIEMYMRANKGAIKILCIFFSFSNIMVLKHFRAYTIILHKYLNSICKFYTFFRKDNFYHMKKFVKFLM